MAKRKIVQIAFGGGALYALRSDGTAWRMDFSDEAPYGRDWEQLRPIPQDWQHCEVLPAPPASHNQRGLRDLDRAHVGQEEEVRRVQA